MLVGFILVETNLIEKIRNIETIAWTTLIFGVLLFVSDKFTIEKTLKKILVLNQQFLSDPYKF